MSDDFRFDWNREARTGVPEAVLAENKSTEQLIAIINQALDRTHPLLLTRMSASQHAEVAVHCDGVEDYDAISKTLIIGQPELKPTLEKNAGASSTKTATPARSIGVVAAGTSDVPVASEAARTLQFYGIPYALYTDVGVAGLWRLTDIQPELKNHSLLIAIAGMEGALFSVLSGLVSSPVIAVPSSVGYGVASGGTAALHSALASCSPGLVTVNIDNGFGAASAAKKMLSID